MAHTPKPIRRAQKPFNTRVNKWKREMSRRRSQMYRGRGKNVIFIDESWKVPPQTWEQSLELFRMARNSSALTTISFPTINPVRMEIEK